METNFIKSENPKKPLFNCDFCNFITNNKKDFKRHTLTSKHIKNLNMTNNTNKNEGNTNIFTHFTPNKQYKCDCGKEYLHMSSLCKHKKNCFQNTDNKKITEKKEPEKEPEIELQIDDEGNNNGLELNMQSTIVELLKQNQEFQKQIIELMKDNIGNTTNNNIINNTTNNKFNLNVFLNETCKDALNFSEFLEMLTLSLTDFENFGPLGYCGGISNILVKGLNKLDISKRPIHCSDLKREVIHVKNNDTWHKDEDNEQMIKAIKAIEHKNVKQMSLWAKANPEYKDPNNKKSDLYTKLIDQSLGETDKEKARKNYNKIIRIVAKEILVDKA